MTSSGPEQARDGTGQPGDPALQPPDAGAITAGRSRRGRSALDLADLALVAGTLLYLIFMILPWYRIAPYDLGSGYSSPGSSANGFDSGLVVVAFVLLVLASAWALLPAFVDVPVPFPRALVTLGLSVLVLLLTLVEWLSNVDDGFTLMGLLALLSAVAVLALAVLRLRPEVCERGSVPSGLLPARWARRAAPGSEDSGPGAPEPTGGSGA